MKALIALLLAACSVGAFADGATFITAGPAVSASSLQHWKKDPFVASVQSITMNRGVFGANVLTIVIDGKTHRFVGHMGMKNPYTDDWSGIEGDMSNGGYTISLSRGKASGDIGGYIWTMTKEWQIKSFNGSDVILRMDHSKALPMKTPPPELPPIQLGAPLGGEVK